jgi:hypothetical protein
MRCRTAECSCVPALPPSGPLQVDGYAGFERLTAPGDIVLDLERFMAKRIGAKTIEVNASHLSLISHPEEITRLILEAAGQQA